MKENTKREWRKNIALPGKHSGNRKRRKEVKEDNIFPGNAKLEKDKDEGKEIKNIE